MKNKNLLLSKILNQLKDTYDSAVMPKQVSKSRRERRG
jgi:hypothetical protein